MMEKTNDLLRKIDIALRWNWDDTKQLDCHVIFEMAKEHIIFLSSEISQLKAACAEWSEVSQHNYQKAKSATQALEAIRAVIKVIPSTNGET